jgi:Na+-transporting methylmalonyl-CoA/oxaloacetate decarboxylase gamma subunit
VNFFLEALLIIVGGIAGVLITLALLAMSRFIVRDVLHVGRREDDD